MSAIVGNCVKMTKFTPTHQIMHVCYFLLINLCFSTYKLTITTETTINSITTHHIITMYNVKSTNYVYIYNVVSKLPKKYVSLVFSRAISISGQLRYMKIFFYAPQIIFLYTTNFMLFSCFLCGNLHNFL